MLPFSTGFQQGEKQKNGRHTQSSVRSFKKSGDSRMGRRGKEKQRTGGKGEGKEKVTGWQETQKRG